MKWANRTNRTRAEHAEHAKNTHKPKEIKTSHMKAPRVRLNQDGLEKVKKVIFGHGGGKKVFFFFTKRRHTLDGQAEKKVSSTQKIVGPGSSQVEVARDDAIMSCCPAAVIEPSNQRHRWPARTTSPIPEPGCPVVAPRQGISDTEIRQYDTRSFCLTYVRTRRKSCGIRCGSATGLTRLLR